ncbi:hypothetical protein ABZP36_012286 [Zizania latifolia]
MADLTLGAVDKLLGKLSAVISDEAQLIGGIQGDIQFIRDEMDSMNGFLLHLNKTETLHDDQIRAWMKQVRDIAYIAGDCIELYTHDLDKRDRLANKIRELKVRVRDVGERRLRYGVNVPDKATLKPDVVARDRQIDDNRENFLHDLQEEEEEEKEEEVKVKVEGGHNVLSFRKAIGMLPSNLGTEAGTKIEAIRKKIKCENVKKIMKMLLCALYAYPYGTEQELTKLKEKVVTAADVDKEVMVYCYSKLSTHYKSCLQYLTAFLQETSISRTCLIRRWVAEGLVARDDRIPNQTLEEAGEVCFNDLVFRGFIQPAAHRPGLKIKSCLKLNLDDYIDKFIVDISKSENFVAYLPTHLNNQLGIRKNLQRLQSRPPQLPPSKPWSWNTCGDRFSSSCIVGKYSGTGGSDHDDDKQKHPMDIVVKDIKKLREEYQLNVLDLGGCHGLKERHLKSICKMTSLKYLSLRKTDITRLPTDINQLRLLETLDLRETHVRADDTKEIFFPKMKHLLAGCHSQPEGRQNEGVLDTVRMPRKIGSSTATEILRHVRIKHGEKELGQVQRLKKLRKLGVVIDGGDENRKHLIRTIEVLSESLHSLSVWITAPRPQHLTDGDGITFDKIDITNPAFTPPEHLESLNIRCFRGNSNNGNLPSWIQSLKKLSKVTLHDTLLKSLEMLGKLENLRCLRLGHGSYIEAKITLRSGEFQNLRLLQLVDHVSTATDHHHVDVAIAIDLEVDAAPKLEKISWAFDRMSITADTISGIKNHQSLKEIEFICDHIDQRLVAEALGLRPERTRLVFLPSELVIMKGTIEAQGWDEIFCSTAIHFQLKEGAVDVALAQPSEPGPLPKLGFEDGREAKQVFVKAAVKFKFFRGKVPFFLSTIQKENDRRSNIHPQVYVSHKFGIPTFKVSRKTTEFAMEGEHRICWWNCLAPRGQDNVF